MTGFTLGIVTFWVSEMVEQDREAVENLGYEERRYSFVISIFFGVGLLRLSC